MLHYVTGDLLDPKFTIFCHQVNCQGVMGGGVAKQIKDKYPEVFAEYKGDCFALGKEFLLGTSRWVKTNDGRYCVNMFAQDRYGRDKRYTDYEAFALCLRSIIDEVKERILNRDGITKETTIAFPYMIGCGLGGGNWSVIEILLEWFERQLPFLQIYIVKKE